MSVRIVVGDCRETLATLPTGSVHCIVTSPPYYGLRDYGVGDQIGLEDTPDAYVAELVGVFRELRRVLRDDGVAWLNLGDSYAGSNAQAGGDGLSSRLGPSSTDSAWTRSQQAMRTAGAGVVKPGAPGNLLGIPWRVAFALQSDGWTLRDACVWHKPNPMPESVAGTRWERCRVKVSRSVRAVGGYNGDAYGAPQGALKNGVTDGSAEWRDCPGCDKCAATDGYVLRSGSWRHTSAHEMVFMLTKGMGYFCDQEAVRDAPTDNPGGAAFYQSKGIPMPDSRPAIDKAGVRDKSNTGLGNGVAYGAAGRNPRNVWSIATRPYSGAHFATMPPDLAERCIKAATSARGVCPACGAQWAPVVEGVAGLPRARNETRNVPPGAISDGRNNISGAKYAEWKRHNPTRITGHRPTCDCPPADPIPATVLDPFGGAGTTALVADRLGRDAILCELNAEYAELARSRLVGDAPMLASVEVTT